MNKIGRNDPCPCGSGKKFKKCHLGKLEDIAIDGTSEFSVEMSTKITSLPPVDYGRSKEIVDGLDIEKLTGSRVGIKFIDLTVYNELNIFGNGQSAEEKGGSGSILVNVYKTTKSDPDNVYVAISKGIGDSALGHQIAHVLDYLGGSELMPGLSKPLSFELGIPVEHLEHPHEYGYWLEYIKNEFNIRLDADDTIVLYLYENGMLIKGSDIEKQDSLIIKSKSDRILKFLGERSGEIDALIRELPGYIGTRTKED